jgi:nitroreductase
MPNFNPEVLDFLSDRHSYPARSLSLPVPDDVLLAKLLTIAARSPDHGKLVPWRFLVLKKPALTRISCMAKLYAQDLGVDAVKTAKAHGQFDFSNLAVVVVSSPREIEKVPLIEQVLSAGAVCIGLANAAQAAGFGPP